MSRCAKVMIGLAEHYLVTTGGRSKEPHARVVESVFFTDENGFDATDRRQIFTLPPGQIQELGAGLTICALPDDWNRLGYRAAFPDYDDCLPDLYPLADKSRQGDLAPAFGIPTSDRRVLLWCDTKSRAARRADRPRFTVTDAARPEVGAIVQGETWVELSEDIAQWFKGNNLRHPEAPGIGEVVAAFLETYEAMPQVSNRRVVRGLGM